MVLELRGVSCLPLEEKPRPREGIMVALTFGREIEECQELEEAVATYAAAAMEKVRRQGARVGGGSVFIQRIRLTDGCRCTRTRRRGGLHMQALGRQMC